MNTKKQTVKFVIDENLDIKNHLIGLNVYKSKLHSGTQQKQEKYEKLLKMPDLKRISFLKKDLQNFYLPNKKKFRDALVQDLNNEWAKIDKEFFKRLEKVHANPFPYKLIKGVLSTANRFGYNTNDGRFATSMFNNKFISADVAMHEIMHFMFHKYFWKLCKDKGLDEKQTWDIKEVFTVLLNLEFSDLRFQPDRGYPEHIEIRKIIEKSWRKNKDFNKALETVINFLKH